MWYICLHSPSLNQVPVEGIAILHQFPFSSVLQRMTVIVQEMGGDQLVFMKGAPERVASFCQPETGKWSDLDYNRKICPTYVPSALDWQIQLSSGHHQSDDSMVLQTQYQNQAYLSHSVFSNLVNENITPPPQFRILPGFLSLPQHFYLVSCYSMALLLHQLRPSSSFYWITSIVGELASSSPVFPTLIHPLHYVQISFSVT